MKILITSDTHGKTELLLKVIKEEKPDKVFFLGDQIDDIYDLKNQVTADICAVRGNVDYGSQGLDDLVIEIEGVNFFLTHGHKYRIKYGLYPLYLKAQEYEADYVFFGHTHMYADFTEGSVRFINPGSLGKPRDGSLGSYVVLNIEDKKCIFTKKMLTS